MEITDEKDIIVNTKFCRIYFGFPNVRWQLPAINVYDLYRSKVDAGLVKFLAISGTDSVKAVNLINFRVTQRDRDMDLESFFKD